MENSGNQSGVHADEAESPVQSIPERYTLLWDYCLGVGIRGSDDLRKELGLDEVNFRHIASSAHAEPRRCYIYRVLDEVQKAAICIMQWQEFLAGGMQESHGPNGTEAQLRRLTFEAFIDDQQFRARKLTEILVDSILFSTTNDQVYFRDYYYLHDLNDCGRSQADRLEYFGFHSLNTKSHAEWIYGKVQELEQNGLDLKKRWHLNEPGPCVKKWATKGVPFSSFGKRYKAVFPLALPNELAILGKSYVHAYGTSRDVHFSPHDISSDFDSHEFLEGTDRVGLLILALNIRCQLLMGCTPEGVNKQWRTMHDGNPEPGKLIAGMKSNPAEVGDIVWAQGDLAEVLEITKSKYDYLAYRVKYLEQPPLPEVPEDWFAVFEIGLVAKKALIENTVDQLAREVPTGMPQPNREQLLAYAKQAVVRLHHLQQQQRSRTSQSMEIQSDMSRPDQNQSSKP